jgi:hypothetical protein
MATSSPLGGSDGRALKPLLLALVFPLFLAIALPGLYLAAMHEPTPRGMAVEIVGTDAKAQGLASNLQSSSAGKLTVTTVADAATGKGHVEDLQARGAFDPATGTLYTATAGSPAATQAVKAVFTPVAKQTGTALRVRDVAPLPADDRVGVTLLFVGLPAILAGFVSATVLGMGVPGLRVRDELGLIALVALIGAVTTGFVAYGVYGALHSNALAVGLLTGAGTMTAGLIQSGGLKLIGSSMTMVSVTILVLLGVPASGIAVPVDMAPALFETLHGILPTAGVLDGLRRIIYFDGTGISGDLLIVAFWALLGAGMIWVAGLRDPKDPAPDPGATVAPTATATEAAA